MLTFLGGRDDFRASVRITSFVNWTRSWSKRARNQISCGVKGKKTVSEKKWACSFQCQYYKWAGNIHFMINLLGEKGRFEKIFRRRWSQMAGRGEDSVTPFEKRTSALDGGFQPGKHGYDTRRWPSLAAATANPRELCQRRRSVSHFAIGRLFAGHVSRARGNK